MDGYSDMRLLFLSLTALLSLFLTSVNGFNPEDLERLKGLVNVLSAI